jgi:hypothetical protein
LTFLLMGDAVVNPGGTVSFKHPRGMFYFSAQDCRIIKTKSKEQLYVAEKSKADKAATADAHLELALWCVENGMLKQADQALSAAWKADPKHQRVQWMVALSRYRNASVPLSPSIEQEMPDFVKNKPMTFARSRHFVLLHDCSDKKDPKYGKTIAEHRLELLEQVYDSLYMKYTLEGYPLRVPREPMRVVLFDEYADDLNFVKLLSPALQMAAGFYAPEQNIAIFYRQKSDEAFQGAQQLVKVLQDLQDTIKRNRISGGGEIICFARTLELLIDISAKTRRSRWSRTRRRISWRPTAACFIASGSKSAGLTRVSPATSSPPRKPPGQGWAPSTNSGWDTTESWRATPSIPRSSSW